MLDLSGVGRTRGLWWGAVVVLVALTLQLHGADSVSGVKSQKLDAKVKLNL